MAASQVHSFILTAALIGFPASSDVCNENKLLDRRKVTTKFSLYKRLLKALQKLVNHSPAARDLQASFSRVLPTSRVGLSRR